MVGAGTLDFDNGIILLIEFCCQEKERSVSSREFIALGTASQVPTRERNHNAYLLRWDNECFLFDPGEGAQRQLTLAGIAASSIHHICITHFHGDHCLGLAGIIQRLSVDRCTHPIHLYYPESGQIYVDRLRTAAIYQSKVDMSLHPIPEISNRMLPLYGSDAYTLHAHALDHSVPAVGYRLEEKDRARFLPEKLEFLGLHGPIVGELQRKGAVEIDGRRVFIDEVTESRRGSIFAFVMDTRFCPGAVALATDADLVVLEATYTSEHLHLAALYRHSTAADSAKTAGLAGARQLALTHFSQRYADTDQHLKEAREIFPQVVALKDMDRIPILRNP